MRRTPLRIAVVVWAALTLMLLGYGLLDTGGVFAYALDDAYIHLAIAKNVAEHGVWGPTRYEFVSASSSPLWTAALAAFFAVAGVREMLPLLLNAVACAALLALADRLFRQHRVPPAKRTLGLVAIAVAAPLPTLTLIGMEHVAHALFTLAFFALVARVATRGSGVGGMLVVAALMCATRYEGVFAVLAAAAVLALRRRWWIAAGVLLAGVAPLVAFGAYSVAENGDWLPHSLTLKSRMPDFSSAADAYLSLGGRALNRVFQTKATALVCLLALTLLLVHAKSRATGWGTAEVFGALVATTTLLHLQLAGIGQLLRYEAYLVVCGLVAFLLLQWGRRPPIHRRLRLARAPRIAAAALIAVGMVALAIRGGRGAIDAALAMRDRYLEHLLPAEFVDRYYGDAAVALHDLGAMAFYTDARVLDLYGLGSREPILARRHPDGFTPAMAAAWLRDNGAALALIKVDWRDMAELVPAPWIRTVEWQLPRNVVFGDRRLAFYTPDAGAAARLREHMATFGAAVPPQVEVLDTPAGSR